MTLKSLLLAIAACATLALVGCSTSGSTTPDPSASASSSAAYPMKASFCGQEVVVDREPMRIIGAGREGVANIISAGAAEKMVARFGEHGALYGSRIDRELKALPGVEEVASGGGQGHGSISFEHVLELRPDMMYGSALGEGDLAIDNLKNNHIMAVMPPNSCSYAFADTSSNFSDLDAIPAHVRELGALFNTKEKADENASAMDKDLAAARSAGAKLPELKVAGVYYWDSSDELFAYGANSTIQGVFKAANLKNVVDPGYDAMFNGAISPEAIVKANPDVIVVTTGESGITLEDSIARMKKIPGMTETTAFRNKRIIELPSGAAYPTVEAIDAAGELVKVLSEH
ncbi:ABC transporter substrate-binding protein [Schaalia sp. 19OD2882]|uniref:ABC transporter substrate-binding protein n=1 Tax=Schaalia sp. 19OD2882 TaxID=2794089 RepID=UPI001C1EA8FF|nr:ABC transporter substrate-binding protein [Schaalia sp. 19OD2882]QWW19664.1 ABC transporter substrate-binding protein [Schaalia sp. 19OD2882]